MTLRWLRDRNGVLELLLLLLLETMSHPQLADVLLHCGRRDALINEAVFVLGMQRVVVVRITAILVPAKEGCLLMHSRQTVLGAQISLK